MTEPDLFQLTTMPNHCENIVAFTGPKADLKRLDQLLGDKLSFESFHPMPPALRLVTKGADLHVKVSEAILPGIMDETHRPAEPVLIPVDEAKMRALYGAADWYEWSNENWGTKWDAYHHQDVERDWEGGCITHRFDTAWDEPHAALLKLSALFPTLRIEVEYAIEGGCGDGSYTLQAGEEVDA